jgi:hypothetical protein
MKMNMEYCFTRLFRAVCVSALVALMLVPVQAYANPLNQWQISCRVDNGAITKRGGVRTFRTGRNHCPGGIFSQRSEIYTDSIPPTRKGAFLFETYVAMSTNATEQFTIFQLHDGRLGCAPPLSIDVKPDGRLLLKSDIKTGEGESCIRGSLSAGPADLTLRSPLMTCPSCRGLMIRRYSLTRSSRRSSISSTASIRSTCSTM